MKNILLPTDFSESSLNAIDYAMRFFENCKCNFYILNVQKISEYNNTDLVAGSKTDSNYDSVAADNKKLIDQLIKKFDKQFKTQSYNFHRLFDYNNFVSAVDHAVKTHSIDLIIMGSNGASGVKELIFGSNTLRVIRNIDCPTLTIPINFRYSGINNVQTSKSNSKDFSPYAVKLIKEILNI